MSQTDALRKIEKFTQEIKELKGKDDATVAEVFVREVRKGNEILDIEYAGKKIRDNQDYKTQKEVAQKFYDDLIFNYKVGFQSPFEIYAEFTTVDFIIRLFQATSTASTFTDSKDKTDPLLKAWFVMGFYASTYELACKVITSLTRNLLISRPLSCGDAADLLKNKFPTRYAKLTENYDNFLRNAISHSQYIITDAVNGEIDCWEVKDGVTSERKKYSVLAIFQMTVNLLFFIVATYATNNEAMEKALIQRYKLTI